MNRKRDGDEALLSMGESVTLVEARLHELGTLLFRRKRQREKQRT